MISIITELRNVATTFNLIEILSDDRFKSTEVKKFLHSFNHAV
jgi:hypothetical protein